MLRTIAVALFALALITPAYAAQVTPSDEDAIRTVIETGNASQSRAIALRDPDAVGDHAVVDYQSRLARTNRGLLDNGVTEIALVNIDWGPITVDGATASATTVETWRTSYAAGPTEFARDRNVYTLVRNGGVWRVASNDHPDARTRAAPAEPDGSDPGVEVPDGQSTSSNWAGYAARGGSFTSVSGTWTVPELSLDAPFGADAAWVGIGGLRSRDLIQAGTQQVVSGTGSVTYQAWFEKLPDVSHPLALTVLPGHTVTVSIDLQAPDTWLISLTNVTTGQMLQRTETYASSHSSAEWIQEAPFARRRVLPLTEFGAINFSAGSAVKDGVSMSISDLEARAISLIDSNHRALAVPSPLGADGASFTVSRS